MIPTPARRGIPGVAMRRSMPGLIVAGLLVSACIAFATSGARAQWDGPPKDLAELYWRQGFAYHMLGAYGEAIDLFKRSIESRPTPEGHTYLGWSLSFLGQLNQSIAECKKAIALDPDYGNPNAAGAMVAGWLLAPDVDLVPRHGSLVGLAVAVATTAGGLVSDGIADDLQLGATSTTVGRGSFLQRTAPVVYAAPVYFHALALT